jgi:hypothetical protein
MDNMTACHMTLCRLSNLLFVFYAVRVMVIKQDWFKLKL